MPADPRAPDAHAAVAAAVAAGVLPPVRTRPCAGCRTRARYYHHAQGYAPEQWLAVVALCARCHSRRHAEQEARKRREYRPRDGVLPRINAEVYDDELGVVAQAKRVASLKQLTFREVVIQALREWVEREQRERSDRAGAPRADHD